MNNRKKFKKISIAMCLTSLVVGCTDNFEEINTNPNFPESAAPELLLPGVLRQMASEWGALSWGDGNTVSQFSAKIQFTAEDRYFWSPNESPWFEVYDAMRDVENILRESKENPTQQNFYGVGLIVKAWLYSYLTDAYGDVPFTEATQGSTNENLTPAFTPQSEIYNQLLIDLKTANEVLIGENNINGDIIFSGDINKWRKFSNSLRMRLLMRISDVDRSRATSEMNEIANNPAQFPLFEGNADAAVLQWNSDNQHPLFDSRSGSFDETRLSITLEDRLKELNDMRLVVFAQPIPSSEKGIFSDNFDDYQGLPNSLDDADALSFSPSGDPAKTGSNFISRLGILIACRACSPLASPTASQTIIMSYSEVQFLLAEARERNFITVGDSKAYYENGIQASFQYYTDRVVAGGWNEIANAMQNFNVNAYMAQPKVTLSGTNQEKLKKIALQKWISLFYTGFEAWNDWKRTSMPAIIASPSAGNDRKVPVRFLYPNSVKSTNNANYQEAASRIGGDDINTLLWWDTTSNN